jgi:hypothetical protein
MKSLTRKQLERRKAQAVRFTRDVLDDPDRADEIEDESLEEYADQRHVKLVNPRIPLLNSRKGEKTMPVPTRRELLQRIRELESDNEDLQDRLEQIGDLASTEEEEEEGSEEDDDSGE